MVMTYEARRKVLNQSHKVGLEKQLLMNTILDFLGLIHLSTTRHWFCL